MVWNIFFHILGISSSQLTNSYFQRGRYTTNQINIYILISHSYTITGWWFGTFFSIYWECHHPNWRTHIFQRGRYTTKQINIYILISHSYTIHVPLLVGGLEHFSPHLCVGFLFLILYPASSASSPAASNLSHTTLSHTIFHTPLCHPPSFTHNFVTHNFVTHHLSPTTFQGSWVLRELFGLESICCGTVIDVLGQGEHGNIGLFYGVNWTLQNLFHQTWYGLPSLTGKWQRIRQKRSLIPDRMMRPRQLVVSKFWNHNELEERRGNSQPHLVPKQPYATKPFFALIPSRCDATICNPNTDTLENIFGEILDSFPMLPCCVGTENERYQTWISWATILANTRHARRMSERMPYTAISRWGPLEVST